MEETSTIASASISDRGLSEKRPENEDSYLDVRSCGIFAVADGVGGAQAGDVASQMAVEILGEAFVNKPAGADAEEVMQAAVERANSAIFQMSHDLPQLSTMATTLVALHIKDNVATIGHVGDSRMYKLEPGKGIVAETDDHSVVAEEVRAGRLTPAQAVNHPAKNVISRALGSEPTVEIDLKTIMFEPGTSFLLCSDGVTRHIDDAELEHILGNGSDLAAVCEQIKRICYERGAEDNLTAVVVRSGNVPEAVPRDETIDHEEITQASARSPFESVAAPIVTTEPVLVGNGHQFGISSGTESTEAGRAASLNKVDEPDVNKTVPAAVPAQPAALRWREPVAENRAANAASSGPSGIGKALSALAMLLVGGAIGAAAVYFWVQTNPRIERVEVPVLQEKSANVPLTAFEESRRLVDRNPENYINANAANPQDATDFYLLGRAYLLSGKYWESKQALLKARDQLGSADAADARTLTAEIAMALSIINSGPAQEAFARDISTLNAAPPTANTNSDAENPTP